MHTIDLSRFVEAQKDDFTIALNEIKSGRKISHWMWYIFPQIAGLGNSSTSIYFSIKNIQEAEAYLIHPSFTFFQIIIWLENIFAKPFTSSPDQALFISP
jgi:uncharacterized protein (DUF1810 family)